MQPTISVNTTIIEYTEISIRSDSFEPTAAADFERFLKRADEAKSQLRDQSQRSEEIKGARARADRRVETETANNRRTLANESSRKQTWADAAADVVAVVDGEADWEDVQAAAEEVLEVAGDLNEQGFSIGANRIDRSKLKSAVLEAGLGLPEGFRHQLSRKLIGSGETDLGVNGLKLIGGKHPAGLLKNMLEGLGGERSLWHLDREALPALGKILSESGVDGEEINDLLGGLAEGPLNMDRILKVVSQAEKGLALSGNGEGLTATSEGLSGLGQFFLSLGMSPEAVQSVTAGFQPGQKLTSADLRRILSDEGPLAPCLGDGDLSSLMTALKSMGASGESLSNLTLLLGQNQGQVSMDDFLGLLALDEQPKPDFTQSSELMVREVQNLLNQTSRENELVKTPLFNEIIIKLAALGDRELDENFNEHSPALQALRGGLAGMRQENMGQGGDFNRSGRQSDQRERQEDRLVLSQVRSETLSRGLENPSFSGTLSEEMNGYEIRERLAKQLEQKLVYSVRRGIHHLKMDLDPESLGRLDVELKVKDDKLTAHIRAESLEAFEALEKEITSLKESLGEAGLDLALTLSFDGQEEKDRTFARSGEKNVGGSKGAVEARTEEETKETRRASRNLVDRLV